MPDDGPDRYLTNDELRARRDYHVRELRQIMDEIDRRSIDEAERPPTPGARKHRHLWSIPTAVGAVALWFVDQVREHPVRSVAATGVLVAAGGLALMLPHITGPPSPALPGALPPVVAASPMATPSPTVTASPTTAAPTLTAGPMGVTVPPTTNGPPDDPVDRTEFPTSSPTPRPTETPAETPQPTARPSPPPKVPAPGPTPTVTRPPDPTETPTPTPSPTPSPTPTQPDGRDPLIRICLALPPILRLECLELL